MGKTRSLSEKEYRTHHLIGMPVEDRDAILRKLQKEGPWTFTLSFELALDYNTTTSAKEFHDELVLKIERFHPVHKLFFDPLYDAAKK